MFAENLCMNSPRLPPVGRASSSDNRNHFYNRISINNFDEDMYQENQLGSMVKTSKPLLPPLDHNGKKQRKTTESCKYNIFLNKT